MTLQQVNNDALVQKTQLGNNIAEVINKDADKKADDAGSIFTTMSKPQKGAEIDKEFFESLGDTSVKSEIADNLFSSLKGFFGKVLTTAVQINKGIIFSGMDVLNTENIKNAGMLDYES